MKQITNKSKKLFIVLLIFMLLSNFIFPNVAMAVVTWRGNDATGSIQEIADSMRTTSNASSNGTSNSQKTIKDLLIVNKTDELETAVIEEIKSAFPELEDGMAENVYNYYANSQDMIEVTCHISGNNYQGSYTLAGFTITFGEKLTQKKIMEDLEGKTDEEIGNVNTENRTETASSSSAAGQNPEGGTTVDDKDIVSPTTGLDAISGIILEPTVRFFTFVIDAIMSVFSSIMTQQDFEYVMVDKEEIGKIQSKGEVGATYTIPDMTPYQTFLESLGFLKYPNFSYSPEEIFAGKIDLLDINFINGSNEDEGWGKIRDVVSQWYQILRMIAIIGLLSVLIYTGIKIIMSSTASDKAKYKEMITNWLVAVLLAFSMHYIMAFILSVIEELTGLIGELTGVIQVNAGGTIFQTNLIGLARFQIQQQHFTAKVGYLIIYTALVVYTFKFTFVYLKRVLKMAFLTVISPIVALTYPIDKINDGQAQGFNMWLKEFIFNALLQPMHYLLYYILVSSSLSLAASNPIYAIVVLMFMSQAEKILKKIFGFGKARAGTVGGIAGAFATGAVTSSLIKHVSNPLHPFGGGKSGSKSSSGGKTGSSTRFDYGEIPNDIIEDTDIESFLTNDIMNNYETNTPENMPENIPTPNKNGDLYNSEFSIPDLYDKSMISLADEGYRYWELSQDMSLPEEERQQYAERARIMNDVFNQRFGGAPAVIDSDENDESEKWWRKYKVTRGLTNVGKSIVKPVWDTEKDFEHNAIDLGKKVATGVAGATIGVSAAAVQAGISITDGKYNPMEGVATIGAGIVGAQNIAKGVENSNQEYKEDEQNIKKYAKNWYNDDNVISYYNKEFPGKGKEMRSRAAKNYVTRGVTDFNEQKQAIKFAEQLKGERGMDEDEADKLAVATLQYKKSIKNNYTILFDKKKRKDYLDMTVDAYTGAASKASVRKLHNDFLENVLDFDRANQ